MPTLGALGRSFIVAVLIALVVAMFPAPVLAQPYEVTWYTIDGGGTMEASGGGYEVGGTIGQPDAGKMTGGDYAVIGGFWPVTLPAPPTAKRPMAEDCATIGAGTKCNVTGTCTTDADCWEESHCVITPDTDPPEGVCYAPKTRFLSIAANPEQMPDTARRVKLDDGTELGWVGAPYEVDPLQEPGTIWLAEIQANPHYETQWPGVVHVMGCEIAHASLCDVSGDHCDPNPCPGGETCVQHSYHIQAIGYGLNPADEGNYSEVLELRTNSTWGNTVSTITADNGRPPDGSVGLEDVMAAIKKYQIVDVAPIVWLDIASSTGAGVPDQVIGIDDIMNVIDGYGGNAYPGLGPLNCP